VVLLAGSWGLKYQVLVTSTTGRRQLCAHPHGLGRFGIFRPFIQQLSPAISVQSKALPVALCQTVYWTGIPRLKGEAAAGGRLFIVDGTP
jgi:hypothetical protein